MATISSSLLPLIFIFLMIFILTTSPSSATKDLVESICKDTKNYTFCMEALYTDPPITDGGELSVYSFALASRNASKTLKYIATLIKGGENVDTNETNGPKLYLSHLKKCEEDYEKALDQLNKANNDINSEIYYYLCSRAKYGVHAAQKCGSQFQTVDQLLTEMNHVMDGISHICMVVSQLYIRWPPCKI